MVELVCIQQHGRAVAEGMVGFSPVGAGAQAVAQADAGVEVTRAGK